MECRRKVMELLLEKIVLDKNLQNYIIFQVVLLFYIIFFICVVYYVHIFVIQIFMYIFSFY